ncbi:MAG: biotin--[acetyl-CoA-carboxylase] ligase [Alphaproteobacteria bacterium]|nr:biotin--[acetyl-CoA-carboxylase] ligase [Alphaproteobacteria bacterium]
MTGAGRPTVAVPDGFTLVALEEVGSTNEEALKLATAGAATGTVVWAERQNKGRGRRGRAWDSPAGNLYCSIVLRPKRAPSAQVSFVAAVALAEAVESQGRPVQLKWPNDVLIAGAKVAGILLEGTSSALVLGTGVNIESAPPVGTSLRAHNIGASVATMLQSYLKALKSWLARWERDGFAPVRDAWLQRAIGVGQSIEVRLPAETLPGTFDGLDADGVLLLGTPGGVRRIAAGDVFLVRA